MKKGKEKADKPGKADKKTDAKVEKAESVEQEAQVAEQSVVDNGPREAREAPVFSSAWIEFKHNIKDKDPVLAWIIVGQFKHPVSQWFSTMIASDNIAKHVSKSELDKLKLFVDGEEVDVSSDAGMGDKPMADLVPEPRTAVLTLAFGN